MTASEADASGAGSSQSYYGSYIDQLPKSPSANTYPNGLRPPSKPVVARPLTPPGERVKRVFNFDD